MSKPQTIELHLLGQKIVLKASGTDPKRAKQIVELVSGRLKDAEKRAPRGSLAPHQVCLLALLDLAEDHLLAKEKTMELKAGMEDRIAKLQNLIDAEQR